MAICAANMRECDKKAKCIFGPNEGQAYNPKDPCCGAGTFNASQCDCENEYWHAIHWWSDSHIASDATCSPESSLSAGYMNPSVAATESGTLDENGNYGSWQLDTSTNVTFGQCPGSTATSVIYKVVLYDGTEVNPQVGINRPGRPLVFETSSYYPAYYWYRIRTTVGYGNTPEAAQSSAAFLVGLEANLVPEDPSGN